jgi:predicted ATPase
MEANYRMSFTMMEVSPSVNLLPQIVAGDNNSFHHGEEIKSDPSSVPVRPAHLQQVTRTPSDEMEAPRFMDASTPMMKDSMSPILRVKASAMDTNKQEEQSQVKDDDAAQVQVVDWKSRFQRLLYDRSEEQNAIFQAYQSIQSQDTRETCDWILISGPCGTGKTVLAKSLQAVVEQDGGYFLMGKFDKLKRIEPFRAFVVAISRYIKLLIQRGDREVAKTRQAILQAVGHEIGLLTSIIPDLQKIVGQVEENVQGAGDARCRFVYVMRMFMRAICTRETPIVILFDDLHHADPCSLKLIQILISDKECGGLVIAATCLDTVSPTSVLSTALRKWEDEDHARILNISVANLECKTLNTMLVETFQLSEEDCMELSDIICRQTDGRMLYVMEFMRWLEDEGLLKYDQGSWNWDETEIGLTISTNRVGDFLQDKLERLPKEVQEAIKVAACLGSNIDQPLLDLLMGACQFNVLEDAVEKGVLVIQQDEYRFKTDGFHHAAYSLIPPDEEESFHLAIGRQLLKGLDKKQLEDHIFTVLNQFKNAETLITNQTERDAIAMLCLHAGKVAARSSAFLSASEYLKFGITLLAQQKWRQGKDLTLALYNAAAEVEVCLSNFERMDELIEEVLSNSVHRPCDTLQSYCTRIYALGLRDRQHEAIDMGIKVLKCMGETFPKRLCMYHLMHEIKLVDRLLKGKTDEDIIRLPPMTEFKVRIAMRILNIITLNCMMTRPKFSPYVTLKMVSLTIRHGLSEHASTAFGT